MKNQQKISFSGSVASHKNGSVEHSIKTLVTMTRAMLMHAALRCPKDTFSTDICPMSIYYTVWIYNHIPDVQSGLSDI